MECCFCPQIPGSVSCERRSACVQLRRVRLAVRQNLKIFYRRVPPKAEAIIAKYRRAKVGLDKVQTA